MTVKLKSLHTQNSYGLNNSFILLLIALGVIEESGGDRCTFVVLSGERSGSVVLVQYIL